MHAPSDALHAQAAAVIRTPGEARDRLVNGIYRPKGTDSELGLLEEAFVHAVKVEPLEKKIAIAVRKQGLEKGKARPDLLENAEKAGVITAEEKALLAK